MRYAAVGRLPRKRHVQFRENGRLLVEEVMGYEGFSGNESILYHLGSPCRIAGVGRLRWRSLTTSGCLRRMSIAWATSAPCRRTAIRSSARRTLMFNGDVEMSIAKPSVALDGFYRNGEGDEVIYVHRGGGVLRTVFGRVPFGAEGLRGDPARYDGHLGARSGRAVLARASTRPARSRRRRGTATATGSCSSTLPSRSATSADLRSWRPSIKPARIGWPCGCGAACRSTSSTAIRSTSSAGTATCGHTRSTPPTSNRARDASTCRRPPIRRSRVPGFVICTFAPRMLDWDPDAVPLPYHHSNIQSEEVMFYAEGDYAARQGGRGRLHHPAPVGVAARSPAGCGRARARGGADRRAGGDVGHVQAAAADHCVARSRSAGVRIFMESRR